MSANVQHIISGFTWDTAFDQKERATELQERLSNWSRLHMPKEVERVFNKLCPPEQTWRIPSLELDLGVLDFNNLEFELTEKLRRYLNEKLIDLIIYSNRDSHNIEITDSDISHIDTIACFLLYGILPWSYKTSDGSVNQMLASQLVQNNKKMIACLMETGAVSASVRKRMAWQLSEPNLLKIVEGLEPNNHVQIIEFSEEMIKIQEKETIVQASIAGFKKNLWLWILNYLYAERGSVFNQLAFMKSTIRQMADHYNIAYNELFDMIERAVNQLKRTIHVKSDFISVLKTLSKEQKDSLEKKQPAAPKDYWHILEQFLNKQPVNGAASHKKEFNELVVNLSRANRQRFCDLVAAARATGSVWEEVMEDLNDTSVEVIISALSSTKSAFITESIRFLTALCKEMNLHIAKKSLWKIAIDFLQQKKNGSFANRAFLDHLITTLCKSIELPEVYVLTQLTCARIPAAVKTSTAVDIYAGLSSAFVSVISRKNPSLFRQRFDQLTGSLCKQLVSGTVDKASFGSMQKSVLKHIQLDPQGSLSMLMQYPDKDGLRKLIPYLLDNYTAALLLKQMENSPCYHVLVSLKQYLKIFSKDQKAGELVRLIEKNLLNVVLQAIILHPGYGEAEFTELILQELAELVPYSQAKQFGLLTGMLSAGISEKITGHDQTDKQLPLLDHARQLMHTAGSKQAEVAKLLRTHFADKTFTLQRGSDGKESALLSDYLLTDGAQCKTLLVKEYTDLLMKHLTGFTRQTVAQQLNELYWKCILDYPDHRGNTAMFKKIFKTAVLYYFPLPDGRQITDAGDTELMDAGVICSLTKKIALSYKELFLLIRQCLSDDTFSVTIQEHVFQLSELIVIGLELKPAAMKQIIADLSLSEAAFKYIQASVSFERFSAVMMSHDHGVLQEAMEDMHLLHHIVADVKGQIPETVVNDYWEESWKLIKTNTWHAAHLEKLVNTSFRPTGTEALAGAGDILSEIKEKDRQLTPALKAALTKCVPALVNMPLEESVKQQGQPLLAVKQKGLLDHLTRSLVVQRKMPVWLDDTDGQDPADLLNEIIVHYPVSFLRVLKKEMITEIQFSWLSQSVPFGQLVKSIGDLDKSRQTHLGILDKLYTSFGHVFVTGISAKEIQAVLFRKVLKAWISGNWSILSTENIWNELVWEICTKKGVSKKDLLLGMNKNRSAFPPSLQVSLECLQEAQQVPMPAGMETLKTKKRIVRKNEILPVLTNGIFVTNAGLVMLNGYIPVLLERLGVVSDKKFIDLSAQSDAVHYLQYMVTGLHETEESLLPLNKILCGLPLSEPVDNSILMSEEHRQMIDGLIEAAIGHWPNAGTNTVNGFRGNWLVRNGLLTEDEQKWELTVEKKAYDILINKSPFSFSIIKYPWMNKPIHVKWPY